MADSPAASGLEAQECLRLKVRYYRCLPADRAGHEEEILELPVARTAFVGLHCWNIGMPDGPPVDVDYICGMGWTEAAAEACRIMTGVIRPCMDLCRGIGLKVCHVEPEMFDKYYPHVPSRRSCENERHAKSLRRQSDRWTVLRSGELEKVQARGVGGDPDKSPEATMKRAEVVSPVGDEPLVFYSDQLDEYLQRHGIDTLIYTGFATDMCILSAEGGGRPMLRAGYRCILMRDGTAGVETTDTFPERLATRYGIHRFEIAVGYSTTFADFQKAISQVRAEAA